ncbi:MAG: glycoside hydrolase family 9 protein, partial [Oscillospiraceae bacterium]|nr:glycoside hydrolase family 9 protein [Oscillospiraceae bacterium]
VGGVNSNLEDSAAKAYCKTNPPAKCWVDKEESYSTNEITIYWNSPLVYLLAVTEKADATEPVKPEQKLRGDVDDSNQIDVADAVLLSRYLVSDAEATVTDQGLANADGDKNGKVDGEDVTFILNVIAKKISLND